MTRGFVVLPCNAKGGSAKYIIIKVTHLVLSLIFSFSTFFESLQSIRYAEEIKLLVSIYGIKVELTCSTGWTTNRAGTKLEVLLQI